MQDAAMPLREQMVHSQLLTNKLLDVRLVRAFTRMPREKFVPAGFRATAYADRAIPLAELMGKGSDCNRVMLEPMVLARLLQAAEIVDGDRVLVIGCGSGYAPAIVRQVTRFVFAVEDNEILASRATSAWRALGIHDIDMYIGALEAGCENEQPFDAICVCGGVDEIPEALFLQLREMGRLVAVQLEEGVGRCVVYRKHRGQVSRWVVCDATARLLPGFERKETFIW